MRADSYAIHSAVAIVTHRQSRSSDTLPRPYPRRNRVALLLALKAALRKLGILRPLPKDNLHYATQRQKDLVKEIRRAHGFQAANQAMDEIDAMMARSIPSEQYP